MKVNIENIKRLREETGAGIADCRMALEGNKGNFEKAKEWLRKKGMERADKKAEREVKAGWVFSYVHHNGKAGAVLALACETDFVAKTDDFQKLGKELVLQVTASRPANIEEFLKEDYVREPSKKIEELIKEVIGKLGENIQVLDFKVVGV